MKHRFVGAFMAVLCASPLATTAEAEPLTITKGSFALQLLFVDEHPEELSYVLKGDTFKIGAIGLNPHPAGLTVPCWPGCLPGERLSFSNRTDGFVPLGQGPVTIDGTTYENVHLSGALRFVSRGPIVPPFGSDSFPIVEAPFSFRGRIVGHVGGEQVFAHQFRGSGTGRIQLFAKEHEGIYIADEHPSMLYTFSDAAAEPVPEPATLLFVGTGLALGAGRRWRRRTKGPRTQGPMTEEPKD